MGRRKVPNLLEASCASSSESVMENNRKLRQNDDGRRCGSNQVCAKAVRELMEKSIATRGEIEIFTSIVHSKDAQISECEEKIAELIEKLSCYRERAYTSRQTICDKNEIIAIMKQTIKRFEANEEMNQTINKTKDMEIENMQAIVELNKLEITNLRKQLEEKRIVEMKKNQDPRCFNIFTNCWK